MVILFNFIYEKINNNSTNILINLKKNFSTVFLLNFE